jgi:hypothetical protein
LGIEGEEVKAKGIDNIFNKITVGSFPNLNKERVIKVEEAFRIPPRQDQKKHPYTYYT